MFCVICEAVSDLLVPTLMAHIIDDGIKNKSLHLVIHWGGFMFLVTFLGACFAVTRNILASKVSQRFGADLRYDLFQKIMSFSEPSMDKLESGSLITRMTNDTSQITMFVNGIMRIFLKAPVMCIGSIIMACILNLRLSIVIFAVAVIVSVLIIIGIKLSYPLYIKLQKSIDKINSVIQEYLIGIRLVKAFGTYPEEEDKFKTANTQLTQQGIAAQMIITFIGPIVGFVVGIATVAVIYMGSILFEKNLSEPGEISAFIIYMAQILGSLIMIIGIFTTFVRTKASNERIKEILESEEDFPVNNNKNDFQGSVEFQKVTFAYPNGSGIPALKDLSFSVNKGETLAIIGPTGSGKSTLAWLMLRFYDVDSGCVLIDNKNIKLVSVDSLRKNIAIVPQNPMLFSGSIEENIRWGDDKAGFEDINKASEKAEAHFITEMEEKYKSILGSGGVNLSGGQKQRISIARGLLKKSPILILDDATSALDAVTETKVKKSLQTKDRIHTLIIITQKCSTAMSADKILVLENGTKMGFGTHKELLSSCEVYKHIYNSQIEGGLKK